MLDINIKIDRVYSSNLDIRTVKKWGADEIVIRDGYTTVGRGDIGQFEIYSVRVQDSLGNWTRDWSANSNYFVWNKTDMIRLANLQLVEHGYRWGMTESEILSVMNVVLPDGWTLKQKMGWLVASLEQSGGNKVSPMWSDTGNWLNEPVKAVGGIFGGQKIEVTEKKSFDTVYNGIPETIPMYRIVNFQNSDWGKTFTTHPYKVQHITVATHPDRYGDYVRGYVSFPVLYPASDFAGNFVPTEYWIPERWLEPV